MKRTIASLAALLLLGLPASGQSARAPAALVLIPGAGGAHPQDFLVMSQPIFRAHGLETQMTTSASQAASLIADYKSKGFRVTLVGMSLGAVTAAQVIAGGTKPDAVVFAAGGLLPPGTPNGSVLETLGDPTRLPRTLVLHHRADECFLTPPDAVPGFVRWSRGKARVHWIQGGGGFGPPCRPNTPHTFNGRTEAAAGAIAAFAKSR